MDSSIIGYQSRHPGGLNCARKDKLRLRLRSLFFREHVDRELDAELRFHLDHLTEENVTADMAPDEARRLALIRMGSITQYQEESRDMRRVNYIDDLLRDLRYAGRNLRRSPGFAALAVLIMALGIGANTSIYSFMDSLLLRSLPVSDPASLAVLNWGANPTGRGSVMHGMSGSTWSDDQWRETGGIFPFPAFELIRTNSAAVFSIVFAYYPTRKVNVMLKGQAEQAGGEFVSGDYFRGLEVSPAAGRLILPDDDRAGAPPVAVLSYTYSLKRFGDAASALGQSLLINHVPFTIAGVAPPGFFGVDPAAAPDFYLPLRSNLLLRLREGPADAEGYLAQGYYWLEMMARLRPGVTLSQAQAALAPLFHQWVDSTAVNDRERAALPALLVRPGAAGIPNPCTCCWPWSRWCSQLPAPTSPA